MGDIDNVICLIYAAMTGQNATAIGSTCDKSIVTLDSLTSGSSQVAGSTSSTTSGSSTVIGASLGSYTVTSSTIVGYGAYASSES